MLIIPANHCQTVTTITSPNVTDGYSLITLGIAHTPGKTLSQVAVDVLTAMDDANITNALANDATITQTMAYTDTSTGLATASLAGTNSNPMPPPNVSVLVAKRTTARGRRGQGRNFWPQLVQVGALSERGLLDATVLNNLQDIFDDFREALIASDLTPCILQNDEGQTPALDPPPSVTRFVVDGMVSTQRRRLRR